MTSAWPASEMEASLASQLIASASLPLLLRSPNSKRTLIPWSREERDAVTGAPFAFLALSSHEGERT